MSSPIKTFIFMDCETTGLESWSKITELCLVAIQTNHLLSTKVCGLPRVLNKLSLCLNPMKLIQPQASNITGLNNDLLEFTHSFTSNTLQMLECFIRQLPQPACLVAHNGDMFDFKILRNHIKKYELEYGYGTIETLLSVDSLKIAYSKHDYDIECLKREEEDRELLSSCGVELTDDDDDDFLLRARIVQAINETTPTKKEEMKGNGDHTKHGSKKKKLNFGKKRPSFKLGDWYERLSGQQALRSHEAEADAIMMAKCAAILGEDFVTRANRMAVPFLNIEQPF